MSKRVNFDSDLESVHKRRKEMDNNFFRVRDDYPSDDSEDDENPDYISDFEDEARFSVFQWTWIPSVTMMLVKN